MMTVPRRLSRNFFRALGEPAAQALKWRPRRGLKSDGTRSEESAVPLDVKTKVVVEGVQ